VSAGRYVRIVDGVAPLPLQNPEGQCYGWDGWIKGSAAGNFLMGAGSTLRWRDDATLAANARTVVEGIAQYADNRTGWLWAFNESDIIADNLPDYCAGWVTRGLLDAHGECGGLFSSFCHAAPRDSSSSLSVFSPPLLSSLCASLSVPLSLSLPLSPLPLPLLLLLSCCQLISTLLCRRRCRWRPGPCAPEHQLVQQPHVGEASVLVFYTVLSLTCFSGLAASANTSSQRRAESCATVSVGLQQRHKRRLRTSDWTYDLHPVSGSCTSVPHRYCATSTGVCFTVLPVVPVL
jgi:hypothetical protein